MSNSKLKQIKDVVRNFDVRDPRAAIVAIEDIINAKSLAAKQPKPVLTVKVFQQDNGEIRVDVMGKDDLTPGPVMAAKHAIAETCFDLFGEAVRDDEGKLIGFEKYDPYKAISQTQGTN